MNTKFNGFNEFNEALSNENNETLSLMDDLLRYMTKFIII